MTTQHTGGNWYAERILNTIDKQPNDLNTWHVKSTIRSPYVDAPRSICCFDCSPEGKANAHLIAAAPDMFDALQAIVDYMETAKFPSVDLMTEAFVQDSLLIDQCKAALAKAKETK